MVACITEQNKLLGLYKRNPFEGIDQRATFEDKVRELRTKRGLPMLTSNVKQRTIKNNLIDVDQIEEE